MKVSTKKATCRDTRRMDSSYSQEIDRGSEGGNNGQGGMVGKTGDDGNNEDGNSSDEQDVLVVDEEM